MFWVIFTTTMLLLFAGSILISFTNEWGYEKVFLSKDHQLDICERCQKDYGNLRIEVGKVREGDYLDANETKQHGDIAELSMSVRGYSSKNKTMDVYEGQNFTIDKYDILVEKIDIGVKAGPRLIGAAMGGITLKISPL